MTLSATHIQISRTHGAISSSLPVTDGCGVVYEEIEKRQATAWAPWAVPGPVYGMWARAMNILTTGKARSDVCRETGITHLYVLGRWRITAARTTFEENVSGSRLASRGIQWADLKDNLVRPQR